MRRGVILIAATLVLATGAAARAEIINVPAGGNLQAALDRARPGDTILLAPGATYAGDFVLPAKSGTGAIVIRSAAPDGELPPSGTRITPGYANRLPKIHATNGSGPAIATSAGAHDWVLRFLEFTRNPGGTGAIIAFGSDGSSQSTLASVPQNLTIDRCYIHGEPGQAQLRGVALNSGTTTIRDSYISEIKAVGADSQAIAGWNGPGPYRILNNYLEAAGENILIGGSTMRIPNVTPTDIEIRNNHLNKPVAWRNSSWSVKNLLELKHARDVTIEGNILEHNWLAAQPGYSVLFTPRNQYDDNPWTVVENVAFVRNIVRHVSGVFNILGYDDNAPSRQTSNITIRGNVFENVSGSDWGGTGRFMLITEAASVTVDHNTIFNTGNAIYAYGGGSPSFVFTNNIVNTSTYGIMGDSTGEGNSTIAAYFAGGRFAGNLFVRCSLSWAYPAGNEFPASYEAIPFVNLGGGDYNLSSSSTYCGCATDGTDPGADMGELAQAIDGSGGTTPPSSDPSPDPSEPPGGSDPPPYSSEPGEADIVLHARDVARMSGAFTQAAVDGAADGTALVSTDTGWASVDEPLLAPVHYVEFDFTAQANTPYHVWLRLRAAGDNKYNDSVWVQFSGDASAYQAGTTNALMVNLEDCSNCGLSGWGWQDGAWWLSEAPVVSFSTPGTKTIRIQLREDGVMLDQVILGASTWVEWAPGPVRDDTTIVPGTIAPPQSETPAPVEGDIVLHARDVTRMSGAFTQAAVDGAADGTALVSTNTGWASVDQPLSAPVHYVEFDFTAEANTQYHVWLRLRAADDNKYNDSVWVQFSGDVSAYQAGTTSALMVNLEDCSNCGLSGWGWQDGAWWLSQAPVVSFSTPGTKTIRIQLREDGVMLDQVILGVSTWAESAPGPVRDDTTIVPGTIEPPQSETPAPVEGDIVLHARDVTRMSGAFTRAAVADAADGTAVVSTNTGWASIDQPLSAPVHYVEFDFTAEANTPYHVWLRLRAADNNKYNDSVWVQFSGDASAYQVGTPDGLMVNLEDCSNCGLSGWGWQDGAWWLSEAPVVSFSTPGTKTIRIQLREDGVMLDQVVLGARTWAELAPGPVRDDTTIVPGTVPTEVNTRELVMYAADAARTAGSFVPVAERDAAGGLALATPDAGWASTDAPLASPVHYVEFDFDAEAGVDYRVWLRLRAGADNKYNDSVWVQFGGDASAYRSGTTSGLLVNLENCSNCGMLGWGWQDGAWWLNDPSVVRFQTSGTKTIRIQVREDGASLDQVVLSSATYLSEAPGPVSRDTTIVSK